jgi:hypothetical protein
VGPPSRAWNAVRTGELTCVRQVHRYAGLSLILTARGDLDQSVHVAGQMLDRAIGIESGRIRDRVEQVVRALRPRARDPVVATFLERAGEHIHTKDI